MYIKQFEDSFCDPDYRHVRPRDSGYDTDIFKCYRNAKKNPAENELLFEQRTDEWPKRALTGTLHKSVFTPQRQHELSEFCSSQVERHYVGVFRHVCTLNITSMKPLYFTFPFIYRLFLLGCKYSSEIVTLDVLLLCNYWKPVKVEVVRSLTLDIIMFLLLTFFSQRCENMSRWRYWSELRVEASAENGMNKEIFLTDVTESLAVLSSCWMHFIHRLL